MKRLHALEEIGSKLTDAQTRARTLGLYPLVKNIDNMLVDLDLFIEEEKDNPTEEDA